MRRQPVGRCRKDLTRLVTMEDRLDIQKPQRHQPER